MRLPYAVGWKRLRWWVFADRGRWLAGGPASIVSCGFASGPAVKPGRRIHFSLNHSPGWKVTGLFGAQRYVWCAGGRRWVDTPPRVHRASGSGGTSVVAPI